MYSLQWSGLQLTPRGPDARLPYFAGIFDVGVRHFPIHKGERMNLRMMVLRASSAATLLPVLLAHPGATDPGGPVAFTPAPNVITIVTARQGCLDIQPPGNMTVLVARACNGKSACSFRSPGEQPNSATRPFCTQGMEITYRCTDGSRRVVTVPGDAWKHGPAQLACNPPDLPSAPPPPPPTPTTPPPPPPSANVISVVAARQGCLDIQPAGNMTSLVARACNGKASCSYQSPGEQPNSATRTFCSQGLEIAYQCSDNSRHVVTVPGDAWKHGPAQLGCNPSNSPSGGSSSEFTSVPIDPETTGTIRVDAARQGCLDIQPPGNMTAAVARACNGLTTCEFKAPNGTQPGSRTRPLCTQQLEITYHCGQGGAKTVSTQSFGEGDAWAKPPLALNCSTQSLVATNYASVVPPRGPVCDQPNLEPPGYYLPPSAMLDWIPTVSTGDYTLEGFRPPAPAATRDKYTTGTGPVPNYPGAPGSVMGANEGRLRSELRAAAAARDPIGDLCMAAQKLARNGPASGNDPSDREFGNAFADLAVTGRAAFARFIKERPTEATLRARCAGVPDAALTAALDRAYRVADSLRAAHDSAERRALGWVAVSGEDDQPYLPVNVPGTEGRGRASYPLFHIPVTTRGITVTTRYMIAHANPTVFPQPRPLLEMSPGRTVRAEPLPALAPDAEVILFIHGMDSRVEEALQLTDALHRQKGHNWTMISMDLPSSGYADNIDHGRIGPVSAVACHHTPLVDFVEDFVVEFVNALDAQLAGQLKPRIRAVVGGSLGGNMSMRLGRRDDLARLAGRTPDTPWITTVVPWSPASIWPSYIATCPTCGCDTGWDLTKDLAVNRALKWAGREERFLPQRETPELRRELFYGGFDWQPVGELGGLAGNRPQAQCWFSDNYACKQRTILAARLDRQETYDANFRAWHWRLGAEQLAFSHQQNRVAGGPNDPLYQHNTKPMLLFAGEDDKCARLGEDTQKVAAKMVNTPGYMRFLRGTGHSLDNEYPEYIASRVTQYLNSRDGAMSTAVNVNRAGADYMSFRTPSFEACRSSCSQQEPCRAYTFVKERAGSGGTCWLKGSVPAATPDNNCISGLKKQ
ncbi:MAG TPA: PAN domain-containing protein [Vicinamibacterales bacterium]|nr:PAN domain-containing protein [Vicinamibacterales bacterium]